MAVCHKRARLLNYFNRTMESGVIQPCTIPITSSMAYKKSYYLQERVVSVAMLDADDSFGR